MKAIEGSTVRDLGSLFINGGFMITVNPCTDHGATEICQSVLEHANNLPHDGLLVVERRQKRGRTVIDRPHVHWVLNIDEKEAKEIEKMFRDRGLDVKLTDVYDPRGLCWYLCKYDDSTFYRASFEDDTASGTPPSAAMEQQREGVPIVNANNSATPSQERAEPLSVDGPLLWLIRTCATSTVGSMKVVADPLARLVRVGMTRAP